MELPVSIWSGVVINRLCFGLVGYLTNITVAHEGMVHLRFCHMRFTDDTFDKAKLGISGITSMAGLLCTEDGPGTLHLMVRTLSGQLRAVRCACMGNSQALYINAKDYPMEHLDCLRGQDVVQILELRVSAATEVLALIFYGDTQWETAEACLHENLRMTEMTRSILRKTLCPPIS